MPTDCRTYHSVVQLPRIGLTTYRERASWGVWDVPADLLPASYSDAIQAAGAVALLLPPASHDPIATAESALDGLHGLLLAGGADLDPSRYGASRSPDTGPARPDRDAWELALARVALCRGLPLLGICRGMQVMNVAAGGTLLQHLPESHGHHEHRRNPGSFDGADHDVRLSDGSLAARAAGEVVHGTKSHHHQAVDRLGEGFEVTGWSSLDELPEAFEATDRRFALGVQWHPEADEQSRLIGALVAEAAAARNGSR